MNYPKISIVTPSFNSEKYLEETILSIIDQQYINLEYIIIDGGSTDRTLEIIKKYETNLHYWESTPDNGMYHAIQKGFDRSSGDIMAWLNSDDMYHPKALWVIAEIFLKFKEVNWITGINTIFDKDGRTVVVNKAKNWSKNHFSIGEWKYVQQESTFWRRSLWSKSGSHLDLSLKYAADMELWNRFFKYCDLISVTTLIGGFRNHGTSQLSNRFAQAYLTEVEDILQQDKCTFSKSKRKKIIIMRLLNILSNKLTEYHVDWAAKILKSVFSKLNPSPLRIGFHLPTKQFIYMKD